jgi:hypothetical protein
VLQKNRSSQNDNSGGFVTDEIRHFVHIDFSCRNEQINVRFTSCRQNVHMRRIAVLPAWLSCPLPAAFSGSPSQGHRRVFHADGHTVFKVQRAKRQQKSRHKTDQLCLRFFWKVMLVGYVTAESQNVHPRRV